MAQLKGIFINAKTKSDFLERFEAGDVKPTQIAFIKDTHEIWTQGEYYQVGSMTTEEIQLFIRNYIDTNGSFTLEQFKNYLSLTTISNFPNDVQLRLSKAASALLQENVYNWALSGNTDKIPQSKLDDVLVAGYLSNNRFYTTYENEQYSNEIAASNNKFYYDKSDNKLYVFLNNVFTQISGNSGSSDDLGAYLKKEDAAVTYATKEELQQTITNLLNGAPEAYDTLKELADALEQNGGDITNILEQLNNVYTKNLADSLFLTKTDAQDIYVTKTAFEDYQAVVTAELDAIKARLDALEKMWSDVPEEDQEYLYYMGNEEVTTSNFNSLLNMNKLPSSYTTNGNEVLYFAIPESKNLTVTSTALSGAEISKNLIANADGYNLYRVPETSKINGTVGISVV